jgi:hypothetical protein
VGRVPPERFPAKREFIPSVKEDDPSEVDDGSHKRVDAVRRQAIPAARHVEDMLADRLFLAPSATWE